MPTQPSHRRASLRRRISIRNRRVTAAVITCTAVFAHVVCTQYYGHNFSRTCQHNSQLSGARWMEELLQGHERRIRDNLGISEAGFFFLEDLLIYYYAAHSSDENFY